MGGVPPNLPSSGEPPKRFQEKESSSRTFEMQGLGVPKVVPFWDPFFKGFGPQNGFQNGSKIGEKNDNLGIHFWIPFFKALELLGCLLGIFLGFLRLF